MFDSLPSSALEAMEWTVENYQPYFDALMNSPLTADNLNEWLSQWSRLYEVLYEVFSRLSVANSQNTADEVAEKRYFTFLETIYPAGLTANNELQKKLVASGLQPHGFEIPLRNMHTEIELFRQENLPLFTEEAKLGTEYDKIIGAQTVQWDGEEVPLAKLQTVGQDPDRARREQAWRAVHNRWLQDRAQLNDLWVKFLELRQKIAKNAGYDNYIPYRWKASGRFDYTPEDCMSFHNAIETVVVPAVARLHERKRAALGVPTYRPWDMNIDPTHPAHIGLDPHGRPPLKPYETVAEMEKRAADIFKHVDPKLGEYFETMRRESLLDLENRKNKAPGGYCTSFPVIKRPFIFMNAVGLHDDVQTLLHEAGHAFHVFESADLPYLPLKETPIEFAEVASMGMELLAAPYLTQDRGGYYNEADAARARAEHLENMLTFWPYMAVVDAFQHWVYNNINAAKDPSQCDAKWAELWGRFMKGIDWSGVEDSMMTGWHRKLHIFRIPFYYVEYGLAQLGAAQVWRGSLHDQAGAVARYRKALSLGGSVTLPALYEAAGAKFAFDADTLRQAVELIEKTLTDLEAVH